MAGGGVRHVGSTHLGDECCGRTDSTGGVRCRAARMRELNAFVTLTLGLRVIPPVT